MSVSLIPSNVSCCTGVMPVSAVMLCTSAGAVFTVSSSVLVRLICKPLATVYLSYIRKISATSAGLCVDSVCRWSSAYPAGRMRVCAASSYTNSSVCFFSARSSGSVPMLNLNAL